MELRNEKSKSLRSQMSIFVTSRLLSISIVRSKRECSLTFSTHSSWLTPSAGTSHTPLFIVRWGSGRTCSRRQRLMSMNISKMPVLAKCFVAMLWASSKVVDSAVICVHSSTSISSMPSAHFFSIYEASSKTLYWQQSSTNQTAR